MKRLTILCLAVAFNIPLQAQHTFVNNGDSVGIGTCTPQKLLHVVGGGGILCTNGPINAVTADGVPDPNIDNPVLSLMGSNGLMTNHGGLFYWRGFWGHSIDLRAGGIADPQRNIFRIRRHDGGGSWTELFKIAESGNVGIGITEPGEKLEVNGNVRMTGQLYWDWPGRTIELYSPNGTDKVIRFRNSMTELNGNPGGGFDFTHHDGRSVMRIIDGKVGIGTTQPQSALAVNGTVTALKVKVTTEGWADHVFQPGYQLPSLRQLESFIKEKKHLPEMPTEKEVQANGVDVGEIQTKLLQKIEELTLYVIDLNKKLEAQDERISQQDNEIKKLRKTKH